MTVLTSGAMGELHRAWRVVPPPVLHALGLGLLLLGILFHTEAIAAVGVWYDSTAYSHCFFVLPIAAYLAWERRQLLVGVPIRPLPWVVLGAIPLAIAWLGAERLGIMEGRQLMVVAMVELLFLAILGWAMFKALAAPLLYLFFLVPFGAFVTPALQNFTAAFIDVGLRTLGIPHFSDAFIIEIPEGRFFVAEACAGLRFLIASIAFGVLYAVLMYRSPGRRAAFMVASVIIPIVANGVRALGIVLLGHVLGSAQAAAADHLLYGWIFFSIVIMLLILAGLPFREDPIGPQPAPAPGLGMRMELATDPRRLMLAAVGLALFAGLALGFSRLLDRAGDAAPPALVADFVAPAGCGSVTDVSRPGFMQRHYDCQQGPLDVTVQVFAPRVNPARIVAAQRLLTDEERPGEPIFTTIDIPGVEPHGWRMVMLDSPARATATALWVDGRPAVGGLAGRLLMARNSLFGATAAPVLVAVGVGPSDSRSKYISERAARDEISEFLRRQTMLPALVQQLSKVALPSG